MDFVRSNFGNEPLPVEHFYPPNWPKSEEKSVQLQSLPRYYLSGMLFTAWKHTEKKTDTETEKIFTVIW